MFDIPHPNHRPGSLHDQVFKDLIGGFLPDFLTLVAPEPAGRLDLSHWKLLDKETFTDWPRGRRRELDLLAEVPFAGRSDRTALVHVEIEVRQRQPLVNCVETYLELTGSDAEELEALQAAEPNEEVQAMRMTWAEKLEAKGRDIGVEMGKKEGLEKGREEGFRQILLRQLGARFGPLSEDVKRRIEAIGSVERLNQIADQILVAHSLEEMGLDS